RERDGERERGSGRSGVTVLQGERGREGERERDSDRDKKNGSYAQRRAARRDNTPPDRRREIDGKRKTKRLEDREVEIGKIEGGKERERERERQREKAHEIPKQNLMDVLEGLCKITGIRLPPHGETALCR